MDAKLVRRLMSLQAPRRPLTLVLHRHRAAHSFEEHRSEAGADTRAAADVAGAHAAVGVIDVERALDALRPQKAAESAGLRAKVLRQYQSSQTFSSMDWLWMEDYVYRGGALVSGDRVREEGGRREFHLDHLGSPRLVTAPDGYSTSTREFAPFGIQRGDWTQETEGGFDREEPMRFTVHERDFRNGFALTTTPYLDYMHARYYSPLEGRFLSVDPEMDTRAAMSSPQKWNRYAYADNNPIKNIDANGRETVVFIVGPGSGLKERGGHAAIWVERNGQHVGISKGGASTWGLARAGSTSAKTAGRHSSGTTLVKVERCTRTS